MRPFLWQFGFLALACASCSLHFGDLKEKVVLESDVSFVVSPNIDRLTVRTFNGSLEIVEGGPMDQVGGTSSLSGASRVWASAHTEEEAASRAAEMKWVYEESGGEALLSLQRPSSRAGGTGGQLRRLKVPAGLAIKLETSNGNIDLNGDWQNFALETSNGRITVQLSKDWSGNGRATSSNGRIAVRCNGVLDCRLDMKTSNGKPKVLGPPLSQDVGTGSLVLRTSNGHITVTHLFDSE